MKIVKTKSLVFSTLLSLIVSLVFGQQTPVDSTIFPMEALEVKPVFEGGETAMYQLIAQNIKIPMIARENAATIGTAVIAFVIDETGHLDTSSVKLLYFKTSPTVKHPKPKNIFQEAKLDDVQIACVTEAKRVVLLLTNWTIGKADGKAVKCRHSVPLTFKSEGIIRR
jgi:hypothetical protein